MGNVDVKTMYIKNRKFVREPSNINVFVLDRRKIKKLLKNKFYIRFNNSVSHSYFKLYNEIGYYIHTPITEGTIYVYGFRKEKDKRYVVIRPTQRKYGLKYPYFLIFDTKSEMIKWKLKNG